jgi:pseudaminic acid cytidylyltransferase
MGVKVAIIPARGGSRRIPRKNIREFCGQPMIAYSIQAAHEAACFDRVLVSTDDAEIAEVAREYGAEVPFVRPATLADDQAGLGGVVRHAVRWCLDEGMELEFFCCLYATAPFLQAADLQQGLACLQAAPDRQFSFSVASFPFPIQRAIRLTDDGGVAPFQPECIPMRSQDLEPAYHEAGQFFWGRPAAFLAGQSIYSPGAAIPVMIPRHRVQDIDTIEDWTRAEYLFQILQSSNAG